MNHTPLFAKGRILFIGAVALLLLGWAEASAAATCPLLREGTRYKFQDSSTVYYVGADNVIAFIPSSPIYHSWWNTFSDVKMVDSSTCTRDFSYGTPPGLNYRPGSFLVKLVTSPRVYAIEPGNVARWIGSPEIAEDLYGPDWTRRVRDIHFLTWVNLTEGEPMTAAIPPEGMLARRAGETQVYYAHNGEWHRLTESVPVWLSSQVITLNSNVFDERPVTLTSMTLAEIMTPTVDEDMGDPTQ